jgi:hypothetical protein
VAHGDVGKVICPAPGAIAAPILSRREWDSSL